MASLDVPLSNAVGVSSTFANLRLGRSDQFVVGRVIRFWDSRNVKKNGEFMGVMVLLLDESDSSIHGFIPANRASYYRSDLVVGSVVKVDRFEVARCAQTYKITEHEYMIRFIPSTRICLIKGDVPDIKFDKFIVRRYNDLQVLANTNLELPDVVGEIRSVQGSDLSNNSVSSRIVIRLLIEANTTVYLSLWDEAASNFRGILGGGHKSPTVMLVTTVNPKIFGGTQGDRHRAPWRLALSSILLASGRQSLFRTKLSTGNLYLNSTAGTKFFFDNKLPEISEFLNNLGGGSPQEVPCVDTLEGLKRKEVVSIADLNTYISNSNEQTQEADFFCKAKIVGVIEQNGWSFVSCTGCNKKLEKSGTSLKCGRCGTADITGVVRFRVELAVDDGKDTATFVVFDKEMSKLTKEDASELALEKCSNGGEEELPDCLYKLNGKELMFQIRITPFNFTPSHRTFTVSTIIEDTTTQKHDKENGSDNTWSEENVELGGALSDATVIDMKPGGDSALPILTKNLNAKYCRKRRRE